MRIVLLVLLALPLMSSVTFADWAEGTTPPPNECLLWNDGCNDCAKAANGTWDCPVRNCTNMMAGYCRVWSHEVADGPTGAPRVVPGSPGTPYAGTLPPGGMPMPLIPDVSSQSIPLNCTSWFDGCNTCTVTNGEVIGCTEMMCADFVYNQPYCKKFKTPDDSSSRPTPDLPPVSEPPSFAIPEGCTSWFDGCNTCGVQNGQLTFCTERACLGETGKAYCQKFAEKETLPEPWPENPLGCEVWFNGCVECRLNSEGSFECPEMEGCDHQQKPECRQRPDGAPAPRPPVASQPLPIPPDSPSVLPREAVIPVDCTRWFDGCNTCGVENGKTTDCTEMWCVPDKRQEPYCIQFIGNDDPNLSRIYAVDTTKTSRPLEVEPVKVPTIETEPVPPAVVKPNFWGFVKYHLWGWWK